MRRFPGEPDESLCGLVLWLNAGGDSEEGWRAASAATGNVAQAQALAEEWGWRERAAPAERVHEELVEVTAQLALKEMRKLKQVSDAAPNSPTMGPAVIVSVARACEQAATRWAVIRAAQGAPTVRDQADYSKLSLAELETVRRILESARVLT